VRSDQITTKKIDLRETGKFWKKNLAVAAVVIVMVM
jgi:hypothetical protein